MVDIEHDHIEEPTNEELRLLTRRDAIRLLGGAGLALIAGCATGSVASTTTALAAGSSSTSIGSGTTLAGSSSTVFGGDGSCVLIPEETAGPYPLDLSGDEVFFRSDITEGRPGVPLALTMALVSASADCAPISDARVDLWHCDADGNYSGFGQPGVEHHRGDLLPGDPDLRRRRPGHLPDHLSRVVPGPDHPCPFPGRSSAMRLVATSQLAFPPEITDAVYAVEPYSAKGPNTSVAEISQDNVFSDGSQYQMASVTGDVSSSLEGSLLVGVAA